MKTLRQIIILVLLSLNILHAGDFLMPDEAFKPYAQVNDTTQIEIGVVLGEHIYLYKDKLKIEILDNQKITIAKKTTPPAQKHDGDDVYFNSADFTLYLSKLEDINSIQDIKIKVVYQGCSEEGLCYEPSEKTFNLSIDSSKLATAGTEIKVTKNATQEKSEVDTIAETIKSGNLIVILLTFFGFGLLLAMTPCVFPMIPIISGLIISQGEGITTKKAFALSLVYVLSMAVAYTIAGVLAGLFGANLQAALQTPWVVYSFSFVFVALAFSMFGFYELKLPDSLVAKVSASGNRSGYIGVAIMGFLSALIVGPCVAAPLAGALVYIGQTGDALLGGLALFFMSIGMGVPLIAVGVSAGKFMPKPGAWMTMVSAIFGVIMLGVAIWMLEKILDPSVTMIMYSVLGIGFALFLGVFEKDGHFFKQSVAMILFIYSISLFIGFLAGNSSMTQPLGFLNHSGTTNITQTEIKDVEFKTVKSISELDAVLELNKGKKIMLDFSADWCTACKEFESVTFSDTRVKKKMNEFVLIRADVTDNGKNEKALSQKYGVFGPPAIIFFDENSQILKSKTIIGFVEPDEFLAHLNKI